MTKNEFPENDLLKLFASNGLDDSELVRLAVEKQNEILLSNGLTHDAIKEIERYYDLLGSTPSFDVIQTVYQNLAWEDVDLHSPIMVRSENNKIGLETLIDFEKISGISLERIPEKLTEEYYRINPPFLWSHFAKKTKSENVLRNFIQKEYYGTHFNVTFLDKILEVESKFGIPFNEFDAEKLDKIYSDCIFHRKINEALSFAEKKNVWPSKQLAEQEIEKIKSKLEDKIFVKKNPTHPNYLLRQVPKMYKLFHNSDCEEKITEFTTFIFHYDQEILTERDNILIEMYDISSVKPNVSKDEVYMRASEFVTKNAPYHVKNLQKIFGYDFSNLIEERFLNSAYKHSIFSFNYDVNVWSEIYLPSNNVCKKLLDNWK